MVAEMVECLQTVLALGHKRNSSIPAFLTPVLKNIIISLARLPLVNSYTRVPPLVCSLCFVFRTLKTIEQLFENQIWWCILSFMSIGLQPLAGLISQFVFLNTE